MTGRETEAQGWEVTRLTSQAVGGTAGVLGEAGGLRFQLSGNVLEPLGTLWANIDA